MGHVNEKAKDLLGASKVTIYFMNSLGRYDTTKLLKAVSKVHYKLFDREYYLGFSRLYYVLTCPIKSGQPYNKMGLLLRWRMSWPLKA